MSIKKIVTQSASVETSQAYEALNIQDIESLSLQLNLSDNSSADIEFKIQVSNDNTNYVDYPGSVIAITADGNHMVEIENISTNYIRVYFTRTGGSITAEVVYSLKQ